MAIARSVVALVCLPHRLVVESSALAGTFDRTVELLVASLLRTYSVPELCFAASFG